MTDWAYQDNFNSLTSAANWVSVVGVVCCLFLLASWAFLPVEKTHRHYLSISLVVAIIFMNVSGGRRRTAAYQTDHAAAGLHHSSGWGTGRVL